MRKFYQNQKPQKKTLNTSKFALITSTKLKKDTGTPIFNSSKNLFSSGQLKFNLNPEASFCSLKPTHKLLSPQNSFITSDRSRNARLAQRKPTVFNSTVHKHDYLYTEPNEKKSQNDEFYDQKDLLRETDCSQHSTEEKNYTQRAKQYRQIRLIGKGRFANVYLAMHKKTGFIGALKIIEKSAVSDIPEEHQEKMLKQLINEIKIQALLKHSNIIQLYDFFHDKGKIYLFMELGTDGHLFDLLAVKGKFEEETTSIITREIIQGIDYMHQKLIIHRDIKLENIVFTMGMAKICDFGWSIYEPKQFRSTICGTPLYLSPEILIGKKYNQKIDIWAIGTLAHQLATGNTPFGIMKKEQLARIVKQDFHMKQGSPELKSFITFILRKEPLHRPTAEVLLQHPFITKYKDIDTADELLQLLVF